MPNYEKQALLIWFAAFVATCNGHFSDLILPNFWVAFDPVYYFSSWNILCSWVLGQHSPRVSFYLFLHTFCCKCYNPRGLSHVLYLFYLFSLDELIYFHCLNIMCIRSCFHNTNLVSPSISRLIKFPHLFVTWARTWGVVTFLSNPQSHLIH